MTESAQLTDELDAPAAPFQPAVAEVLQSLRQAIAATLAGIGDFGKPADIFKTLGLDRTLSRQLFRLASNVEPMGNGGIIPSRTSIDRFLQAAKTRGVGDRNITDVRKAYMAFEEFVQIHAGDRATFNSMVSAASGVDEDWLAADLQHRRNAFRAMSHSLGMQTKTKLTTSIVRGRSDNSSLDIVLIGGMIGLRVLRALPSLRVHGTVGDSRHGSANATYRPIGLSPAGDGYLMEQFSTSPLPTLTTGPGPAYNGMAHEIIIERPVVGNVGSSTLVFGTVFDDMPLSTGEPIGLHASTNHPTEKLLLDVLIHPELCKDIVPTGRSVIGFHMGEPRQFGPGFNDLQGDFTPEYLGQGPAALSTLEVPFYQNMLNAVDGHLGWGLSNYQAWRMRVEFPLFQSTASIEWQLNGRR